MSSALIAALSAIATAQSSLSPEPTYPGHILPDVGMTKFFAPDAVVVGFKPGVTAAQKAAAAAQYGLIFDPHVTSRYFTRFLIPSDHLVLGVNPITKIEQMQGDPRFEYVETDNALVPDQALPNDPSFSLQYYLHNTGQTGGVVDADVDGPEGWGALPNSGDGIIVAVCDDGFEVTHPDLAANIWVNDDPVNGVDDDGNGFIDDINGWDFVDNDGTVNPAGSNTHGQHVVGIVGMVHNNGIGGAGTAKKVRLMCMRHYNGQSTWMTALANSIDYAWQNGAKVITVSYNIDGYTTTLLNAIGRAKDADVVYCNSAGNNNQNIDNLRGAIRNIHNNAVFIASTDDNDLRSSFSNFGQTVDLATPGSDIWSTLRNGTYGNNSGTSMAAPGGAAIISQIRLANPSLTAAQAIQRARETSDFIPSLAGVIAGGRASMTRAFETDSIAPSNPNDLVVKFLASTGASIRFTGSGDDGTTGQAAYYEVRRSASPITLGNFASATKITDITGTVGAGDEVTASIGGLVAGSTYHLAVRAFDNMGNPSADITTFGPFTTNAATFSDDVEGADKFNSTTWGKITENGSTVWTDSPTGNYGNNQDRILNINSPVRLNGPAILRFSARMITEATYDIFTVEVSRNGGASYNRVYQFSGNNSAWQTYLVSLNEFDGDLIRIRFRLTTDSSSVAAGVSVDNIQIIPAKLDYANDAESAADFQVGTPWALTNERAYVGSQAFSDSPGGNYGTSVNSNLLLNRDLNLEGAVSPVAGFATWMRIARGDRLEFLHSANSGGSWTTPTSVFGTEATWNFYSFAIPATGGSRFGVRMVSNTTTQDDGVYVDDFHVVSEQVVNRVIGTIDMDGFGGNPADRSPVLQVLQPNTETVVATYPITVAGGSFSANVLQSGVYDLRVDGDQYLGQRFNGVTLCYVTPALDVMLRNGDIDNDGEVGPGDFAILASSFLSVSGDPNWSAAADLDGDGEVGPGDFSILSSNFLETE